MNKTIKAVDRALDIIEFIAIKDGAGISDMSRYLELSKSTIFGFVKTFEEHGYIYKDEVSEKYFMTYKVNKLMGHFNGSSLVNFVTPLLQKLSEKYGETICLVKEKDDFVVCLKKFESNKGLLLKCFCANHVPLYVTGVGRSILAERSEEEIDRYLDNTTFEKLAKDLVTDKAKIKEEIMEIKDRGYAIGTNEIHEDTYGLGIAFEDKFNESKFGVSLRVPTYRVTEELAKEMALDLLVVKEKIGKFFN